MEKKQSAFEVHEKRHKLWERSVSQHAKYIDKNTGLFADIYTEERNCPVCGCKDGTDIFSKEGGVYVKCNNCSMIFLNPVFRDVYLNEYYNNNHAVQAEVVGEDMPFYTGIYTRGLDLLRLCGVSSGRLLDMGCSSGIFLDIAREYGYSTYGVELNRSEFAIAREKRHKVYNEGIEDCKFEGKFDVITLWDVFEHLKDGSRFLQLFRKLLAPDGFVFIQTPSPASLAARIMREQCNMFDGLEHVNLYTPDTITRLADLNGYCVKRLETVIPEMHVLENFLNYEPPYLGNRRQRSFILPLIDEKYINDNRLGYKMQMVLQ